MSASTYRAERAIPATPHTQSDTTAAPHPGPSRYPSLTTTVPKELVHRAGIAEVLLTDWERNDGHHFTVTAQWPRLHGFFATLEGYHDPLLIAETVRQTGLLLAHAEFGVPLGHHFLMRDLAYDSRADRLHLAPTPATITLHITCTDIKHRGTHLAGLRFDALIHRDGQPAATATATLACVSPAVYRRLRATTTDHPTPPPPLTHPTPPHHVGRTTPTDVVLSPHPQPGHWQLRADTRHPILFDHPVDHVPGMVLLEAARQATTALLQTPTLPTTLTSQFTRYTELHTPCTIKATPHPPPTQQTTPQQHIHITGHQNNTTVFTTTLTTTPPPT